MSRKEFVYRQDRQWKKFKSRLLFDHSIHRLSQGSLNFVIQSRAKRSFKGICVLCFICVWKRTVIVFIWVYFTFFTALFLTMLHKQLAYSFQLSAALDFPFNEFSRICQKFHNFSSAFWWSYDNESTVYYSSPGQLNLSQILPPIRKLISTPCYLRLKKRFLASQFLETSRFCCRSNIFGISRLIYHCLL